ncbi:hypothetical protein [Spiroplasma endosymbiont of Nebria brevicollis]|uniref:hypothetical protein n=1 Tax=Spiroplasma endosymbiont of Nebria brevicollis TaxID=3066284 RepID=UPI00313CE245
MNQNADKVYWSIPANDTTTVIKANKLLKTPGTNSEAKDDASYDFITKTLNIQPLNGTKDFDDSVLADIEGQITNINPTVRGESGAYIVVGGNFSFQFMKKSDSTVLGSKYQFTLKRDNTTDIVTNTLQGIIPALLVTDTDVVTNDNIKFKINDVIPAGAVKGAVIMVNSGVAATTDTAKAFNSLNSLLGINIIVQLESKTNAGPNWATNDTLTISCKTDVVDFSTILVTKTWTL